MKHTFISLLLAFAFSSTNTFAQNDSWQMVWHDEFDTDGKPNPEIWNFEHGFVRNHEDQWYQEDNAWCENGKLVIEARKESKPNPLYDRNSSDWTRLRKSINYTSSCLTTQGNFDFLYGRLEVKARIPVASGAWPAIWTLGQREEWPSCGEIDIMEYYRIDDVPHILANTAWGNDNRFDAVWNTIRTPFKHFTDKDPAWASKFHIWRMDWDKEAIRIYLDDELLNETLMQDVRNGSIGNYDNPFTKPQYILLNLALGGDNGGTIDETAMPMRYEIDYVRCYRQKR